jgi:uncharacterized protein (TIGR02594 family)
MPRSIELPQEVRLPPLPPSRRGAAVSSSVAAGLVLVAEASRYLGTNPTHRKRLWCATFMNFILAKLGYAGTHSEAARSFLHYGRRLSGPRIGAIAVLSRGKDGGHVGVVTGIDAHRNPILISGNFNRRVGIGVYPRSRVIAYVMPTGAARLSHGSPTMAQPVQASVRRIASRWRRATPTPHQPQARASRHETVRWPQRPVPPHRWHRAQLRRQRKRARKSNISGAARSAHRRPRSRPLPPLAHRRRNRRGRKPAANCPGSSGRGCRYRDRHWLPRSAGCA